MARSTRSLSFLIILFAVADLASAQDANAEALDPRAPVDHTQSLSFIGSDPWLPGSSVTLEVYLTYSGYESPGLSYWLELPIGIAPFVSITAVQYFTFSSPNQAPGQPIVFTDLSGARPGYLSTHGGETPVPGGVSADLGATTPNASTLPSGTYHITNLTFTIAAGAPGGTYTMYSTSLSPRKSEVTDQAFNDNDIPASPFLFTVPEPGTFALINFAIAGAGLLAWNRKRK